MLNIKINDAVFATVNGDTDNSNLSTAKNTMKNKNLILEIKQKITDKDKLSIIKFI